MRSVRESCCVAVTLIAVGGEARAAPLSENVSDVGKAFELMGEVRERPELKVVGKNIGRIGVVAEFTEGVSEGKAARVTGWLVANGLMALATEGLSVPVQIGRELVTHVLYDMVYDTYIEGRRQNQLWRDYLDHLDRQAEQRTEAVYQKRYQANSALSAGFIRNDIEKSSRVTRYGETFSKVENDADHKYNEALARDTLSNGTPECGSMEWYSKVGSSECGETAEDTLGPPKDWRLSFSSIAGHEAFPEDQCMTFQDSALGFGKEFANLVYAGMCSVTEASGDNDFAELALKCDDGGRSIKVQRDGNGSMKMSEIEKEGGGRRYQYARTFAECH